MTLVRTGRVLRVCHLCGETYHHEGSGFLFLDVDRKGNWEAHDIDPECAEGMKTFDWSVFSCPPS